MKILIQPKNKDRDRDLELQVQFLLVKFNHTYEKLRDLADILLLKLTDRFALNLYIKLTLFNKSVFLKDSLIYYGVKKLYDASWM